MRGRVSVVLVAALMLAFAQAPFEHVHQHEETEHHAGAFLHAHFERLAAATPACPELRDLDPDEDAQCQDWFSATHAETGLVPVILAEVFVVAPQQSSVWLTRAPEPTANGPPRNGAAPSRAPPV